MTINKTSSKMWPKITESKQNTDRHFPIRRSIKIINRHCSRFVVPQIIQGKIKITLQLLLIVR